VPGNSGYDKWEEVSYLACFSSISANVNRVEGAVKQILCGMNVKTSASVANAECLDWYRDWAKRN